jgi:DNA polymerase
MNEVRRMAYLHAMGIDVWRLRSGERDVSKQRPSQPAQEPVGAAQAAPSSSGPTTPPQPAAATALAAPAQPRAEPPAQRRSAPPDTDNEPPPWSDADLAGLPADDVMPPPGPAAAAASAPPAVATMDWRALEAAVAGCRACGLCERRTNTVFGVGDRSAPVMFIGEGPGADEDRQGEPFVGRAGKLLNRMLAAAGFRREQVYIANIVKCRPPHNRDPSVDEAAACRAYLERQIALVEPKLIVCLGQVPASNLLSTSESVGRLRGRLHQHEATGRPLIVTYHPSYYLRSPEQKAKGWQDLQHIMELLAEPPPTARPDPAQRPH